jgi:hypothetical protein
MIANVYIKDGNIYIYNENRQFTNLGGLAYELGRPLLDFICYEHDRFEDAFSTIASMLNNKFAHQVINEPRMLDEIKILMTKAQQWEIYIYFYMQIFIEFIYTFVESPWQAIERLESKIPGALDKLSWTTDFEWPTSSPFVQVIYADTEKRLYRAAMDVVALMFEHFKNKQHVMIGEVQLLINFRTVMGAPEKSSMEYLYYLERFKVEEYGFHFYLENPMHSFYGVTKPPEIVQLYQINIIDDLFRFEFVQMIEHNIFIKKCKNCERFFIPRRRADAEYCERIYGATSRKCSEIGATIRYEKKVADNPVLEAHKRAYRRFNSRTRAKKMTQSEFMAWSDEASQKRDECLAGKLPFDEFVAWLEQGRIRRSRSKPTENEVVNRINSDFQKENP